MGMSFKVLQAAAVAHAQPTASMAALSPGFAIASWQAVCMMHEDGKARYPAQHVRMWCLAWTGVCLTRVLACPDCPLLLVCQWLM